MENQGERGESARPLPASECLPSDTLHAHPPFLMWKCGLCHFLKFFLNTFSRAPGTQMEHQEGGGFGGARAHGRYKNMDQGLTFNRSQRGSCSATYETLTQNQVVCEGFSTRFSTNMRCEIGEGRPSSGRAPALSRAALLTDRSRLSGANRRSAALRYRRL